MRLDNLRERVNKAVVDGNNAGDAAVEWVLAHEYAAEWCDVMFDADGNFGEAVMMPRHATKAGEWRFTRKDTGMEWFLKLDQLVDVDLHQEG